MEPIKILRDWIVFPTHHPDKVAKIFPVVKTSPYKDHFICAVPHTVDHVMFFKNLKRYEDISSPIVTQYHWPGKYPPYAHQIATADFGVLNPRSFILNGMGTGKTKATLWGCDYLMNEGRINKTLIVAPLSTLERVWGDEIFCTLPRRKFRVLHGTREARLSRLEEDVDFYIVNHDGVAIIREALAKRPDINHIILDELGCYRNQTTTRWKKLNEVVNRQHPRSCWGMTGTPTPNAPTDAYAQAKLIRPEVILGAFGKFKQDTMMQISPFKWIPKKGAEEMVHKVLQPSIRYALEDCIDLPPTVYQTRVCEMSVEQKHHYAEFKKHSMSSIRDGEVTAANAAVLLAKLVQVACGVVYGQEGERFHLDFSGRYNLLEEVIEECNEKVIIFVPLTDVLYALEEKLKKRWTVEVINGATSSGKRNEVFSDFQKKADPHILLANAGAMAHGLTLTAASTIIWYAPTTSNDTYNQANARIVRPGQTKTTNIVHLCATPTEDRIYQALKEKTKLQDAILELAKEK